MIHFFQRQDVGVHFFQQRFAKGMKGRQNDIFAALAHGFHDARFHFAGGFLCEREPKDVFAEQGSVGFQQMADTLGDDAGFAGARAGDRPTTLQCGQGVSLSPSAIAAHSASLR